MLKIAVVQIAFAATIAACLIGSPQIARADSDTEAPQITALSCIPASADVGTGPAAVSCTASFTDADSGVQSFVVQIQSPTRSHAAGSCSSADLDSGSLTCNTVIGQFVEPGSWNVIQVDVHDNAGNTRSYSQETLEQLHLGVTITVTE